MKTKAKTKAVALPFWEKAPDGRWRHVGNGYFISYNPSIGGDPVSDFIESAGALLGALAGEKMEVRTGEKETALCQKDSTAVVGQRWYILNGDFRKQYEKTKNFKEALAVYKKNIKHRSCWSTD